MKRREKDNAKRAQSRKWYFEKADWIVCDEIEDENADESIEEEEKEEEIVISTVAVVEGQNKVCPVCREEFSQFFKQVGIVILSVTSLVCNAMQWFCRAEMVTRRRAGTCTTPWSTRM